MQINKNSARAVQHFLCKFCICSCCDGVTLVVVVVVVVVAAAAAAAAAAVVMLMNDDMMVIAGSDVFLDSSIHCYLSELLRVYCKPSYLDRMDFTQPVPGLASFYDLYDSHCCCYLSICCRHIQARTRPMIVKSF